MSGGTVSLGLSPLLCKVGGPCHKPHPAVRAARCTPAGARGPLVSRGGHPSSCQRPLRLSCMAELPSAPGVGLAALMVGSHGCAGTLFCHLSCDLDKSHNPDEPATSRFRGALTPPWQWLGSQMCEELPAPRGRLAQEAGAPLPAFLGCSPAGRGLW